MSIANIIISPNFKTSGFKVIISENTGKPFEYIYSIIKFLDYFKGQTALLFCFSSSKSYLVSRYLPYDFSRQYTL